MTLTYLSTFTGIGGLDLGFERAGMECVGMCEIDQNARNILNRHWPEVPKHADITTAISSGWADQFVGRVDVLIGGAPCQDLSIAGKRAGFDGERSVLYFDMVALAAHVGARYVVYENVPGLHTSAQGRDFAAALLALAEGGFPHVDWRTLDSQHFGVPQRRHRIFVVGSAGEPCSGSILVEPEGGIGDLTSVVEARKATSSSLAASPGIRRWAGSAVEEGVAAPWMVGPVTGTLNAGGHPGSYNGQDAYTNLFPVHGPRPDDVDVYPHVYRKSRRAADADDYETWVEDPFANTLNTYENASDVRATTVVVDKPIGFNWQNGGGYGKANAGLGITEDGTGPLSTSQVPAIADGYVVRRITPLEAERLQGFPDGWTETGADGKPLSDSARYRALGNAVTVNVAEYVGRLITAHAGHTS
jgi:DNA (cytosine-5)-methyltransferase 1